MNEKEKESYENITPEILQEMIDEYKNIEVSTWTLFIKDIGKIDVLDMTGIINRATGESKLLVLDVNGGMWQIKEEHIIAQRNNIMMPDDYEHFNEMKRQSEDNAKRWEENEKKLGLNAGFM